MDHTELVQRNKDFTLASWTAQAQWQPLSMVRAEGVYFWDADGKRYLDWSSQAFNVNIGHGHPHVVQALQAQLSRLACAGPGMATEPRARLGELLARRTPPNLTHSFFTLGGSDAVENALKMARMATGRQKIVARYRAYHGATFGAMSVGGDPRRLANEPGVPWVVRVHDPDPYRSPLYRGRSLAEGDRALVDQIAETIEMEGPHSIAAVLLEGYSGASGILQGGEVFWQGVQALCRRHGILLIVDEVLSGFGRTGEWFGIDHNPGVQPDLLVLAKGLTSGYAPLGAVVVSAPVASYFADHTLYAGLTQHAYPLGCAAAIANLEVYEQERLIERARQSGPLLRAGLDALAAQHPSVGEVRGIGLHHVLDLVQDRQSRAPLSGFNQPLSAAMRAVATQLRQQGLSTVVRWNWIFCCPPLVIDAAQIQEGLHILDQALTIADHYTAPAA